MQDRRQVPKVGTAAAVLGFVSMGGCQAALDLDDYSFNEPGNAGRFGVFSPLGVAGSSGGSSSTSAAGGSGGVGIAGPSGASGVDAVLRVESDGYVTAGPFHGYAYTFVLQSAAANARSVTITPQCDETTGCSPPFAPDAICAAGVVGAAADYLSSAYAGFDLATDRGGSPGTVVLPGNPLTVEYTNPGGSGLRLQLATVGVSYCYELGATPSPAPIPLGSFNTACWDNSGNPFNPSTPVASVQLYAFASNQADIPFEFCLRGLFVE